MSSGLAAPAAGSFLDRLGCPDADGSRATLFNSHSPIVAELCLGLDARGTQVAPRLPARPPGAPAGALWHSVHHVKLGWARGRPLDAKACLAARLVWPEDGTIRRLLAALHA